MKLMKKIYTKYISIDDKIRFVIAGCINAAVSYAMFAVALFIIGESHYQLCLALQWILSSIFSYFNQKFFVFCTKGNYLAEYLKCCSAWAVSYFLNVIILEILVRFVIKNAYISQFISLFLVSVCTYVLFKYFAFKQKEVH